MWSLTPKFAVDEPIDSYVLGSIQSNARYSEGVKAGKEKLKSARADAYQAGIIHGKGADHMSIMKQYMKSPGDKMIVMPDHKVYTYSATPNLTHLTDTSLKPARDAISAQIKNLNASLEPDKIPAHFRDGFADHLKTGSTGIVLADGLSLFDVGVIKKWTAVEPKTSRRLFPEDGVKDLRSNKSGSKYLDDYFVLPEEPPLQVHKSPVKRIQTLRPRPVPVLEEPLLRNRPNSAKIKKPRK